MAPMWDQNLQQTLLYQESISYKMILGEMILMNMFIFQGL